MNNNLLGNIIPEQPQIDSQSDVHVLKSRLEWGEPAFTILDVRDRNSYNEGHIMGSMPMPTDGLVDRASSSIDKSRDIYVYGASEEQTAQAVQALRSAGFVHVSELKGGLAAWKAIGGPTEGIVESRTPPGADDYNVVSRVKDHLENQQKTVPGPDPNTVQSRNRAGEDKPNVVSKAKEGLENLKDNVQENVQKAADQLKEATRDSNEQ
ncbi:rhodanese-like domain-containing protein [Nostoc sp. CENA67]|uniref:Rhodanese-like domain-containing protein n=1 Tax=Amazonocrinis nigriterrae CENA67 TaxID=2794033 RepID=A0A8J7HR50_9NOST|nr:rhodanese-like domain-containing protein [Amazonocrinis nigriterrae CENA67]